MFTLFAFLTLGVVEPIQVAARDPLFRATNQVLWTEDNCTGVSTNSGGSVTLDGSDNAQKVWNFFKSKGFSDEQTAGIMGNLAWESGDPTFNNATDSEELSGGGGYGLAQWTGSRRTEITKAAERDGKELTDLQFQLDYLYGEMQVRKERDGGDKTEETGMKEQTNVEDATEYFMYNYERPGALHLEERVGYANAYLQQYTGTGPSGSTPSGDDCTCEPGGGTISSDGGGGSIQQVVDAAVADSNSKGVDLRVVVSGDASASGGVDGQLPSASVIKLLVAATLSTNNVPLSSVIGDLTPMIRDSNNEAANRLIDRAGGFGPINATASSLGADANIGRKMLAPPGASDPNRISAQGSDAILSAIKQSEGGGGRISQDYAEAIMSAMKAQTVNTKWGSSGIPKDKMAHKTGELNGAQHDVGYFFNGDKWLAVSTLTNNPSGGTEPGVGIVKDTAKKIYDAWLGGGSGGGSDECGNLANGQCGDPGLIGYLKCYAWPDYRGSGYTDPTPDYAKAVEVAQGEGRYVGGINYPGIDCGGFITLLLTDSGHEPGYNYNGRGGNTVSQYKWTQENWETLGQGNEINVADLRPGDVANDENNHTFMWIGPVEGFQPTNIASASLDDRAPMAGQENPTEAKWTWFGKR